MVRLTDRPDMTLDVYRGRKTTTQQQKNSSFVLFNSISDKSGCWLKALCNGTLFTVEKTSASTLIKLWTARSAGAST